MGESNKVGKSRNELLKSRREQAKLRTSRVSSRIPTRCAGLLVGLGQVTYPPRCPSSARVFGCAAKGNVSPVRAPLNTLACQGALLAMGYLNILKGR